MVALTFTATDGTVFSDRAKYRQHEMLTQYTYANKTGETLTKAPGSIQGQPFDICDSTDSTFLLLDNSDQVQVDECSNCTIFIAASSESLFIRNCTNCTITVACKQLRTRDCVNCTFYLHCKTEPIIETSTGMAFAPFNGAYSGHSEALLSAGLLKDYSLWYGVFDFNDEGKTGKNWRLLDQAEEKPLWQPLNDGEPSCCARVPAGSIALPSQGADPADGLAGVATAPAGSGGMQSFTFETNLATAAAATGDAYTAQEAGGSKKPPPLSAPKGSAAAAGEAEKAKKAGLSSLTGESLKTQTKTKVGWNPGAFAEPAAAAATTSSVVAPPPPALVAESKTKAKAGSKVGWNPNAFAEPTLTASPSPAPEVAAAALAAVALAAKAKPAEETIFSMIVAGKIPSDKVYEDEDMLAFNDIAPQAPVHVVLIPKDATGLSQLSTSSDAHALLLGKLMFRAGAIGKELCPNGFRVVVNDGKEGAQSVYHLHLHVLGGKQMNWPPG